MSEPTNITFGESTRKGKKYMVSFKWKGKTYIRHFGALGYKHFKDNTGLGIYSHLDHGDKKRRDRYYARQGFTNDPLSPKYWSNKYLW
jgi:hypothetical protein